MGRVDRRRMLENLDDEIRDHIERETRENIERGMPPDQARVAALRKFGNIALAKEDARQVWGTVWVEQFLQDLVFGCRVMRRNAGFTVVIVATLALGVGASTAAFSVANAVLVRPLDYPHPERLVWLANYDSSLKRDTVYLPDYAGWRASANSYSAMAAYSYQQAGILTPDGATQVTGVGISGDFWKLTGAKLALGRAFSPEEAGQVALTWDLFQREFHGASEVIGSPLLVDGRTFQVAAVLAPDFRFQFPVWWAPARQKPVEILFSLPIGGVGNRLGAVVAALKPEVPATQALAELETLEAHIIAARPANSRAPRSAGQKMHVDALQEKLVGNTRPALVAILAAGGFVLLICAMNIANLLLARATARQTEFAVRIALGAGRMRLISQSLAENAAIVFLGCLAGLAVARVVIGVLIGQWPNAVPRLSETSIDLRVAGFAVAVSLGASILFGAGPAFVLLRTNPHGALKEGVRISGGSAGVRARKFLVSVELSLAIVLLSAAGLMLKSFWRMQQYPPGFQPESTVITKLRLAGPQYALVAKQQAYLREVLRHSSEIPGIKAAGISSWSLLSGAPAFPNDRSAAMTHTVRFNAISPGFPHAMGMRLLKGRWLTDGDKRVVLMNESMAREAFGNADPIGRMMYQIRSSIVVGVVSDLKYSKLDADSPPEVFIPYQDAPMIPGADLVLRVAGDPASVTSSLRKLVSGIDPSQPAYDMKTLDKALADSIAPRRFNFFLLGTFAAAALLLALIGIYGVLAFSVARRTREIGIRTALGAQRRQVVQMLVVEGMAMVFAGMAAGFAAAWGLTRLMSSLLYDVKANDAVTFAAVGVALLITSFLACLGPAMRAARLDPVAALRNE